jgi:hypothetical protein
VKSFFSDSFSFCLTTQKNERNYGYCLRFQGNFKTSKCICLITTHNWSDIMITLLSVLQSCFIQSPAYKQEDVSNINFFEVFSPVLKTVKQYKPFPSNGQSFDISFPRGGDSTITLNLKRPDEAWGFSRELEISALFVSTTNISNQNQSSSFFSFSSKPTFNVLSASDLIPLHNWMLLEKSVLVVGNDDAITSITECCNILLSFLIPFDWKSLYVPVLPSTLIDMIGVCNSLQDYFFLIFFFLLGSGAISYGGITWVTQP